MIRLAIHGLNLPRPDAAATGAAMLCQNLNLQISAGEAWLILGQNGCGKSTLLATLAGWPTPPKHSQIILNGKPFADWPKRARAQQLAWLTQQDDCPFPMTVLEKVLSGCHARLGPFAWESAADQAEALDWLAQLDLAGFAQRDLATLSGGERRRVALATTLMQHGSVLLLDEPLSQLDIHHQQQTLAVLQQQRQHNHSLLMVSHDPNHARHWATHALLMFGDSRYLAGPIDQILTVEHLSELYQHPMHCIQDADGSLFFPKYTDQYI